MRYLDKLLGAVCFFDWHCDTNICCDGECANACVSYPAHSGVHEFFLQDPRLVVLFEMAMIILVCGLILLMKRRKKALSFGS